jgi:predicted AlkP superfamily pyrophosphatase or phosphodiesterase
MRTLLSALLLTVAFPAMAEPSSQTLLIVLDGLRPDYVTPERMPNLHALGERGVVCEQHHAVFPTVTRVNAATFSTGAYPETHGLLGNTVYFPDVDERPMSTANYENLLRIEEATDGKLLQATTLGEHLQAAGKKLLVVSSGSSGSSFLLNHKVAGGAIINVDYVLPESLQPRVKAAIGETPEESLPNKARNHWVVDAYLEFGLKEIQPDVTYMWLSDPDGTAHTFGVGHPNTDEALATVDAEVGRIIDTLRERGLLDTTDILVSSDHGFSDFVMSPSPYTLIQNVLDRHDLEREDCVAAGSAFYLSEAALPHLAEVVELLQQAPFVGAIFTPEKDPGSELGIIPGTLSQSLVRWQHPRSSVLLVSPNWTDEENDYGLKGKSRRMGVAGHGSSSPYEIHNTLIVAGPSFRTGARSSLPTHNVDIAPTIAHIRGLPPIPSADGRVLKELLKGGPEPASLSSVTEKVEASTTLPDGDTVTFTAVFSGVEEYRYLDRTEASRATGK